MYWLSKQGGQKAETWCNCFDITRTVIERTLSVALPTQYHEFCLSFCKDLTGSSWFAPWDQWKLYSFIVEICYSHRRDAEKFYWKLIRNCCKALRQNKRKFHTNRLPVTVTKLVIQTLLSGEPKSKDLQNLFLWARPLGFLESTFAPQGFLTPTQAVGDKHTIIYRKDGGIWGEGGDWLTAVAKAWLESK